MLADERAAVRCRTEIDNHAGAGLVFTLGKLNNLGVRQPGVTLKVVLIGRRYNIVYVAIDQTRDRTARTGLVNDRLADLERIEDRVARIVRA